MKGKGWMPTYLIWSYYSALGPKTQDHNSSGMKSFVTQSRNPSSHQVLHTLVWEPVKTLNCKLTSGSFAVIATWSERKSSPSRNVLQTVTWQRLMPTVQRWSSSDKDTNLKQHHQEKVSLGAKSPPSKQKWLLDNHPRGKPGHPSVLVCIQDVPVIYCF